MPLFIVSYDLKAPGHDYQPLYDELERLGAKRLLLSDWALRFNGTAFQLRDHLKQFLGVNDGIAVVDVAAGWATLNAMVNLNNI